MKAFGIFSRRLRWGTALAASVPLLLIALASCSWTERLPELPKMPQLGKSGPDLPAHVGPVGSGSYLFHQHCEKCHGVPPAPAFVETMRGVPTITDPRRVRSLDQDWLYKITSEGGGATGRRSTMPSFKEVLTEAEIRRIISYLNGNPV